MFIKVCSFGISIKSGVSRSHGEGGRRTLTRSRDRGPSVEQYDKREAVGRKGRNLLQEQRRRRGREESDAHR